MGLEQIQLWQVFVSLGVPGLALGVFYMLFRAFKWEFPKVPRNWVGPLVLVFMLLTAIVTLFALARFTAPPPSENDNTAASNETTKFTGDRNINAKGDGNISVTGDNSSVVIGSETENANRGPLPTLIAGVTYIAYAIVVGVIARHVHPDFSVESQSIWRFRRVFWLFALFGACSGLAIWSLAWIAFHFLYVQSHLLLFATGFVARLVGAWPRPHSDGLIDLDVYETNERIEHFCYQKWKTSGGFTSFFEIAVFLFCFFGWFVVLWKNAA
jgi:hypothetical protein